MRVVECPACDRLISWTKVMGNRRMGLICPTCGAQWTIFDEMGQEFPEWTHKGLGLAR